MLAATGRGRDQRAVALAMFNISIADGADVVTAFCEKRKPEVVGTASALPPVFEAWLRPGRVARSGERLPPGRGWRWSEDVKSKLV